MTLDTNLLPKILHMQKTLFSSLRLKDVLDNAVSQLSQVAGGAKVAIFLSDNDSLSLKLMSLGGYQAATAENLRVVPFTAESLLKSVVQRRQPALARNAQEAPDLSAAVMQREQSQGQIGLPLIASNLLVGAVLLDVNDPQLLQMVDVLKDVADLVALAVGNSILFGRSEYERERLGTLYKTSVALSGSSLKTAEVLQITADTALILGNTPHCAVLVFDQQQQRFHVAAFKGLDGNSLNEFNLGVTSTIAGNAIVSGRSEYVPDADRYQHQLPRASTGANFGSVLAVPLSHETEPLGVVCLFSTEQRGFHREQLELLESLAQQSSNALHVALTHESATAQSIQDAHTELYNRWHFEDALQKEIERSQRHKREMAVVLVDIDHLSRVNDLLGHEKGDQVIKHVAKVLKASLRDIDVPCRYGAEEFALILPETSSQAAYDVAERLRQTMRNETVPGIGMVTVSLGLAAFPANAENGSDLMRVVEEALDVAKFEGRDRVKVCGSGAPVVTGRIPWEELVRQAKLAVVSERQSRLNNRLNPPSESGYAPWMRATPGWGARKKD
ncbi:MAG TPA: sensor domain-containing diguanylate cyclase [Candidatus Obscuribacterales bacterium]